MSSAADMEMRVDPPHSANPATTGIAVCLGTWCADATVEQLTPILKLLQAALGSRTASVIVAYPATNPQADAWQHEGFSMQPYAFDGNKPSLNTTTAASYRNMQDVMQTYKTSCGILLGAEAQTLHPDALRGMVDAVLDRNADVALPRYSVGSNEALINAALLYPLSRAIFGVKACFPFALDQVLSVRAAERMAVAAGQAAKASGGDAFVWPTAEAAAAGFIVAEITAGTRIFPIQPNTDLSLVLNLLGSSLFSEIEAKASFWQRTRPLQAMLSLDVVPAQHVTTEPVSSDEVAEMIESFRIAHGNLQEIWSLVLPPQTLLGLKRLSRMPNESFSMPDALWVRILYDFVLAYRLRTINRGHLLGTLTPLYLAWVASHILAAQTTDATNPPESLARAFEADKPYLVSRWRWPDRFNP